MKNKVVIITGASRGIGEAAARELAAQGAEVVLAARSLAKIEAIAKDISSTGAIAMAVACDVSDYESVENLVSQTVVEYGKIDALVNNAGLIDPIAKLSETDAEIWAKTINVNLVGAYNCIRAVINNLNENAAIINLSSGAAFSALEGWSAYCASKAGLAMLTKSIGLEYPQISAYGFAPGLVDTPMQGQIRQSGINPVSQIPQEKLSSTEEVAKAIAWLCTIDAQVYNGQEIDVRDEEFRKKVGI